MISAFASSESSASSPIRKSESRPSIRGRLLSRSRSISSPVEKWAGVASLARLGVSGKLIVPTFRPSVSSASATMRAWVVLPPRSIASMLIKTPTTTPSLLPARARYSQWDGPCQAPLWADVPNRCGAKLAILGAIRSGFPRLSTTSHLADRLGLDRRLTALATPPRRSLTLTRLVARE